MILLIDNYDSFTYNLAHLIGETGVDSLIKRNDQVTPGDVRDLKPEAIVISPGPCTPDRAGSVLEIIRDCSDFPILGVCLGHQAIGQAFGGRVALASQLVHGKTGPIRHDGAGLFKGLPSPFLAARYHSLALDVASAPACFTINATSDDGEIMGMRHQDKPIFGVQFHPESIATEYGRELMINFLDAAGVSANGRTLDEKTPADDARP